MSIRKIAYVGLLALAVTDCALGASSNAASDSSPGTITATIQGPISIVKDKNLVFGTVVRPTSGSTTATVQVTTAGVRSFSAGGTGYAFLASPAASEAQFTISGTASTSVSVTVPASISLSGPSSSTLTVTLTDDAGTALSSGGSMVVNVGGTVPLTVNSTRGAYTGTLTVTASYN